MSTKMRWYLDAYETNNVINILTDARERKAMKLRKEFFYKYICKYNTNAYNTKVERDYAYTALREYRYNVQLNSVLGAFGVTLLSFAFSRNAYTFLKKSVFIGSLSYILFHKYYMVKANKRLFDMCNVGEDTELGYQRNLVLKECNKILNREDF